MHEMIERMVKALVDHPDEVSVKLIEGDSTLVFEVKVNQEDAGKVIGKKGRTINSLRTLVGAAASRMKKKVMLEVV